MFTGIVEEVGSIVSIGPSGLVQQPHLRLAENSEEPCALFDAGQVLPGFEPRPFFTSSPGDGCLVHNGVRS